MTMTRRTLLAMLAAILCLGAPPGVAAERPVVYAVNYPLQYFAQRIAGGHVDVILPVPADVDPAFWQPDAATIAGFQGADLILLNGAGYARWVSRASLPRRKLVDTSAGFRDRYIETEAGLTHSHGREGEHSHTGTAFTTWLDFSLAAEQARAVHDALSRLMPEQADAFEANLAALEANLLDLHKRLQSIVTRDVERPLLTSHPVYQYLARGYALNLKSVMWEPGAMPSDQEWQALAELLRAHPATWMLWEGKPAPEISRRLQRLGVRSVVFDPCANRPAEGDFLSVMSSNVANMKRVFK